MQVTVIATDFDDNEETISQASFNPNFERKPVLTEQETKNMDLDNPQLDIDSDTSEFVPTFFKKK